MNPVIVDIGEVLEDANVCDKEGTTGWYLFESQMPDKPDSIVGVFDTGGSKPLICMDKTVKPTHVETFQVRVRGVSYVVAWDKVKEVMDCLGHTGRFDVAGDSSAELYTHYADVQQTGEPLPLGRDARNRETFSINFQVWRKEETV